MQSGEKVNGSDLISKFTLHLYVCPCYVIYTYLWSILVSFNLNKWKFARGFFNSKLIQRFYPMPFIISKFPCSILLFQRYPIPYFKSLTKISLNKSPAKTRKPVFWKIPTVPFDIRFPNHFVPWINATGIPWTLSKTFNGH